MLATKCRICLFSQVTCLSSDLIPRGIELSFKLCVCDVEITQPGILHLQMRAHWRVAVDWHLKAACS